MNLLSAADQQQGTHKKRKLGITRVLMMIGFCSIFLTLVNRSARLFEATSEIAATPTNTTTKNKNVASKAVDRAPFQKPFSLQNLRESIVQARLEFDTKMKELYGESFFPIIFHRVEEVFGLNGLNRDRFQRRILIKLCKSLSVNSSVEDNTFMWVTGGNSNAAARGNLFNQSYTATVERYASMAFQAVGLNFVAKNYAIGTYPSGLELALCMDSVYGQNFDLFMWDFSLTDDRSSFNLELMLNQIVTGSTAWPASSVLPVVLVLDQTKRRSISVQRATDRGLGAISMNPAIVLDNLKERLPDAVFVDQGNLTEYLANFLCKGVLERNSPCGEKKFQTQSCTKVKGKTSWHFGWKIHHLFGVLLSDLLIQILQEAVEKLLDMEFHLNQHNQPALENQDEKLSLAVILSKLQEEEGIDRLSFLSTPVNETLDYAARNEMEEEVVKYLARTASFCRTALLPAQSRYDGIVTGSGNKKAYYEKFDTGTSKKEILARPVHSTGATNATYSIPQPLPLAFDTNLRNLSSCEDMLLKIDYKDFFLVQGGIGWVSTILPTTAEIETYSLKPMRNQHREGIIILCVSICERLRGPYCPPDRLDLNTIVSTTSTVEPLMQMEVDGKPVSQVTQIGNCYMLRGGNNEYKWGPGNESGQYELKFYISKISKHLHISSIIVL